MNLCVIFNINTNKPECVIVHDYENSNIGYSTYNDELSFILDNIFENKILIETKVNNAITYQQCNIDNSFYLNAINDYLAFPYKILWGKSINEKNISKVLNDSYSILDDNKEENLL